MRYSALLALENGAVFYGRAIGATGLATGEVVFNTSMTGYQEILTDPSYTRQIVALTYPHIGNTGVNPLDGESEAVRAAGLIVRDLPTLYSSWRSNQDLSAYLRERRISGISDIDTRKLTRMLRTEGALRGCIQSGDALDSEQALAQACNTPGLLGIDLAAEVSTRETYVWSGEGNWTLDNNTYRHNQENIYTVVAYDFGVKHQTLRMLAERGCRVIVVPAQTSAEQALAHQPDGIYLSNGPGDPEPCGYAVEAIKVFLEKNIPLFGICFGHQLLGLALGASVVKMKFGHHGANHPVHDLRSGAVMITSQNHGFSIDIDTLPLGVEITHCSLFDGTLQGLRVHGKPAFSFQGHPEASPGPHTVAELFDEFIAEMAAVRKAS